MDPKTTTCKSDEEKDIYLPNLNVSPTNKLRIKEEKCDSTAKKLNRHKLSN